MPVYSPNRSLDPFEDLYDGQGSLGEFAVDITRRYLTTPWITPPLLNGWVQAGAPYHNFQYCWVGMKRWRTRGHLDGSGAGSGSVAFVVGPQYILNRLDDVIGGYNQSYETDIGTIAAFQVARIELDYTNGNATITWPVT